MKILALDVATVTGFAIGETVGRDYLFGSKRVLGGTDEDFGPYFADYAEWLGLSIKTNGIEKVGYEAPVLPPKTQITTLRRLYGLAAVTELVAFRAGVPVVEERQQTIRKHFIGGRFRTIKGEVKREVCRRCEMLGYKVGKDHNAADAIALLDYLLALERPERALAVTPMFQERV